MERPFIGKRADVCNKKAVFIMSRQGMGNR